MPYQVGQDIGGFGRLAEAQRWVKGQERLDTQEAQNKKLFDIQLKTAETNLAEVERGRQFKIGMAKATSQVNGVVEKFQARHKYIDDAESTYPDLAMTERQASMERADKLTDNLYDRDPKAATWMEDQLIGQYHRDRGQPDFKISFDPKTKGQWIDMQDGTRLYAELVFDEKLGKKVWKQEMEGLPEGVGKATTEGIDPEAINQEQIDYFGKLFNLTGKIPSLGRGKASTKVRVAIAKSAAEQALAEGRGGVAETITAQADVKALGASITQQTKQLGSMGSFVKNLDMQIDRVGLLSQEFETADPRFLNIPLRALRGKIAGSANQAIYDMYLTEIESEIGKLATGSTGSVAELSATAQEKWAQIHDKNLSIADMMKLLQETKHAGNIRMKSVADNLAETKERLRAAGNYGETIAEHPADIQAILSKHGTK